MPNEQSNIILYQTSDGVTMVVAKNATTTLSVTNNCLTNCCIFCNSWLNILLCALPAHISTIIRFANANFGSLPTELIWSYVCNFGLRFR